MVNRNIVKAEVYVDGASNPSSVYPGGDVKVNKGSSINVILYPSTAEDDSIDETLIPAQVNYDLVGDIENNKIILPKTASFYQKGKYYVKIIPDIDKADNLMLDYINENYTFYIERSANRVTWEDAEMPFEIDRVPALQNYICLIIGDDGSSEIFVPNDYYYRVRVEKNTSAITFDYNCVPENKRFTAAELESLDGSSIFTVNIVETANQADGTINVKVTDDTMVSAETGYVQVKVLDNGQWIPDTSLDGNDPDKLWPAAYNGENSVNVLLNPLLIGNDYRIFFYDDANKTNERYYDYSPALEDSGTLINFDSYAPEVQPITIDEYLDCVNFAASFEDEGDEGTAPGLAYGNLAMLTWEAEDYQVIQTNINVEFDNYDLNAQEVNALFDFSDYEYTVLGGYVDAALNPSYMFAVIEYDNANTVVKLFKNNGTWELMNVMEV